MRYSRGMFLHKLRYQRGNVALIGATQAGSTGLSIIPKDDFNRSTGIRVYQEERYDTGQVILNRKEKKRRIPGIKTVKLYAI